MFIVSAKSQSSLNQEIFNNIHCKCNYYLIPKLNFEKEFKTVWPLHFWKKTPSNHNIVNEEGIGSIDDEIKQERRKSRQKEKYSVSKLDSFNKKNEPTILKTSCKNFENNLQEEKKPVFEQSLKMIENPAKNDQNPCTKNTQMNEEIVLISPKPDSEWNYDDYLKQDS